MLKWAWHFLLVLIAAIVGGLALYALFPDITPYVGETGAAIWSWFAILASGIAAHIALRRSDLHRVSMVLAAILASASSVAVLAYPVMVLVDFPFRDEWFDVLMVLAFVALSIACLVFFPVYLFSRKLRRPLTRVYLALGALIPIGWVVTARPFGDHELVWDMLIAVPLALFGTAGGWTFSLIVRRTLDLDAEPPETA